MLYIDNRHQMCVSKCFLSFTLPYYKTTGVRRRSFCSPRGGREKVDTWQQHNSVRILRLFRLEKISHSWKNNGHKCPRFKRPGWSNQAVLVKFKSRKIIRICQKLYSKTPLNSK